VNFESLEQEKDSNLPSRRRGKKDDLRRGFGGGKSPSGEREGKESGAALPGRGPIAADVKLWREEKKKVSKRCYRAV